MRKILVLVDGSENAKRALKQAKYMADLTGGSVTILCVCDIKAAKSFLNFSPEKTIDLQVQMVENTERILELAKDELKALGDRVSTAIIEGNPAEEIINYSKIGDFDLAVIGAYGNSGFTANLLGTIARKVITAIDIPILVVH